MIKSESDDVQDMLLLASLSSQQLESSSKPLIPPTVYSGPADAAHILKNYKTQIQEMQDELQGYKTSSSLLKSRIEQLNTEYSHQVASLETRIETLLSQKESLQTDLILLQDTNRVLTESLVGSQARVKTANLTLEEAERLAEERVYYDMLALKGVYNAAEAEYMQRLDGALRLLEAFKNKEKAQRTELKSLGESLSQVKASEKNLSHKLESELSRGKEIKRELVQVRLQFTESSNALVQLEEDKKQLVRNLETSKQSESSLQKELASSLQLAHALQVSNATLKAEKEAAVKESDSSKAQNKLFKGSIDQLLVRIKELEAERGPESRNQLVESRNQNLLTQISDLQEQLDDVKLENEQEIKIWQSRVSELQSYLSKSQIEQEITRDRILSLESRLHNSQEAHREEILSMELKQRQSLSLLSQRNQELECQLNRMIADHSSTYPSSDDIHGPITPQSEISDSSGSRCPLMLDLNSPCKKVVINYPDTLPEAHEQIRNLEQQLEQLSLFTGDAESKMERLLLESFMHSRGSSSACTLNNFDGHPADDEFSLPHLSSLNSITKADRILAEDRLSGFLMRQYLTRRRSEPTSPGSRSIFHE